MPLHLAAMNGHGQIAKLLCCFGANVNAIVSTSVGNDLNLNWTEFATEIISKYYCYTTKALLNTTFMLFDTKILLLCYLCY